MSRHRRDAGDAVSARAATRVGRQALWVCFVLALAQCKPQPAAAPKATGGTSAPHADLTGTYLAKHTVSTYCDEGPGIDCTTQAENTLTLRALPGGQVLMETMLQFSLGHMCWYKGVLLPQDSGKRDERLWARRTREDDFEGDCEVQLRVGPRKVRLSSKGCLYSCGSRGSLEGTFPYPPARREVKELMR